MDRALAVELTLSGRERELALLSREYEEARERGAARFAFVRGPAGIGKSFLFRALRRNLSARGVRVFEGRAARTSPRAYGLFVEVVPELLAHLGETGIPARTVAELSRRLGPLCGRQGAASLSPEDRRLDLCDALAEAFSLASAGAPVLLLSDADAADRASLELLRYLAAAALAPGGRSSGLFVVSYRDDAPLPEPLADLVARTPALGLPLSGLDLDGIRAFLSRREIAERLLEATGGVPTALEEVVAAPAAQPADLFQRRLASLPQGERDALLALAVFAQPAGLELVGCLVARLRGSALLDTGARLERLARERYLEVRPAPGEIHYALARESTRQSILSLADPAEVAALHVATGEELAARGADPEAIARHFLAADPRGRGAVEALRAADSLAGRFAFDEAAELFRRALDGAPATERPAIHARLAQVLRCSGDYVGALRHVGLARRGASPERTRELSADAARLAKQMGRLGAAERLCRRVLDGTPIPTAEDAAGASAFVDYADVLFLRGSYADARAECERGLAAFADRPELALALRNTLGKVHLNQGAYADADAAFALNAELAHALGIAREEARAIINRGAAAHRRGDRRAAIAHYRAGLALCGSDRALAALALSNLGSLYADSAEFEPAIDHLSRALSAFTRARRSKEVAHAALNLARLHVFLNEADRAQELCDHAHAMASEVGDPYLVASAQLVRGEILEARGQLAESVQELIRARDAFVAIGTPRYLAESALILARVHLARGDRTLARGALDCGALDDLSRTSPPLAAERELVAGELALASAELAEATRRLSKAKEILLEHPDLEGPYRVYHLLARLRAAAGDAPGAAADAARSARLLDELTSRVPPASRATFLRHPRRAAVHAATEREITPNQVARALALEPEPENRGRALIGKSAALQKIYKVLDAVARSNATVLVRGESGTGKELLAEAIHRRSPRRDMPLVKVNCAAMVEELLLSELFGHEKGAFTGAVRERKGRFELAEGGTIFLDEIGDISPKTQVALLRVLQEREFERVGGQKTLKADVRVVCATNRDLEAMIAQGQFRQDLYYRLKGVMLELPALRERLDDLPAICEHLLARFARERHDELKSLSPEAVELLRAHDWPGNVRELENVLSSASIFASGRVITPEAFENIAELAPLLERAPNAAGAEPDDDDDDAEPCAGPRPPPPADGEGLDYFELARRRGLSLKDLRHEIESQCILKALTEAQGNISEAARLLQMKRSRLSQIVNADPLLRAAAKG